MRYYLYILIFFIYSCDDLLETSGPLDYENLIIEGWLKFVDKDYEMAEEMFLEVLEIDSSLISYYSEAWLGLGWSGIYRAKELTGTDTSELEERLQLRESAKDWLLTAYNEMVNYSGEEEVPYNLLPDLYAGLSYVNSSMVLHDEYAENSDELLNIALAFSDSVLSYNSNYSFLYDSTNINSNSIHLLRAQLFLQLGDYSQAEEEISQIEMTSSQVNFNLERDEDNSTYDLFLHIGFKGQDKHLFEMTLMSDSTFQLTRSFTPLLPCVDLIIEEIDLSDNEIVECLSSFPTNILEYEYSIRFPNSINENIIDNNECEFQNLDWVEGVGCVDGYIFLMEDFDDPECTSSNGFRTLALDDDSPMTVNSCYNSCGSCDN